MVCPTGATRFSTKDIWLIGNRRGTNSYARWCGGNSGDEPLTYPIRKMNDVLREVPSGTIYFFGLLTECRIVTGAVNISSLTGLDSAGILFSTNMSSLRDLGE